MSKSLIAAASTTAVTATAVPTTMVLSGSFSKKEFQRPTWQKDFPILNVATDIKEKYKDIECLKEHYKTTIEWNNSQNLTSDLITSLESLKNVNEKWGCLMVEYVEQKYHKNKWWGEFRLMWSLSDKEKGIVTVINVKAGNKELKGSSSAYVMMKSNNKWDAKYAKENEERKITSDEDLKKLIPKPGRDMSPEEYKGDNWGFKAQLNNICGTYDCTETTGNKIHKSATWKLSCNSCSSKKEWSENFNDWFKDNFEWENFEIKIENIKGDWILKT